MKEEIRLKGKSVILSEIRLLKARILRVAFNFETALENYQKAFDLNPTWSMALEMADINIGLNDNKNAIANFESAISLSSSNQEKGISRYNYGVYYSGKNQFDNAEYNLNEALKLSKDIVVENLNGFILDKCLVLNAIGTLYNKRTGKMLEAETAYKEAILIYEKRLDNGINDFEPNYVQVLYNYSFLLMQKSDSKNAIEIIKKSIEIREELYKVDPSENGKELADSYDRYAMLLMQQDKLDESKALFEKTIFLKRTLAQFNLEDLLSLEISLSNFGVILHKLNEIDEAEKLYLESLGIIRKLVSLNRVKYIPYQTQVLINLGSFYSKSDKQKSLMYIDELMDYLFPAQFNSEGIEVYLDMVYKILDTMGIKKDDYLKDKGFIPK